MKIERRGRWACCIESLYTATGLSAQLLAPFKELAIDRAIAERGGRVARELAIRLPDALIAATALEHQLGLVTRNVEHFQTVRGRRIRALSLLAPLVCR